MCSARFTPTPTPTTKPDVNKPDTSIKLIHIEITQTAHIS